MMEDISVHINNNYKVEFSRDPLAHKTKMRLKEKWKSPWGTFTSYARLSECCYLYAFRYLTILWT